MKEVLQKRSRSWRYVRVMWRRIKRGQIQDRRTQLSEELLSFVENKLKLDPCNQALEQSDIGCMHR